MKIDFSAVGEFECKLWRSMRSSIADGDGRGVGGESTKRSAASILLTDLGGG